MSEQPKWVAEFGDEYDVPAIIAGAADLTDVSWHNDACPAFGRNERDDDYVIWVEHPDPGKRELDGPRFTVSTANGETTIFAGDDATEALAQYRLAAQQLPARAGTPAEAEHAIVQVRVSTISPWVPTTSVLASDVARVNREIGWAKYRIAPARHERPRPMHRDPVTGVVVFADAGRQPDVRHGRWTGNAPPIVGAP